MGSMSDSSRTEPAESPRDDAHRSFESEAEADTLSLAVIEMIVQIICSDLCKLNEDIMIDSIRMESKCTDIDETADPKLRVILSSVAKDRYTDYRIECIDEEIHIVRCY